ARAAAPCSEHQSIEWRPPSGRHQQPARRMRQRVAGAVQRREKMEEAGRTRQPVAGMSRLLASTLDADDLWLVDEMAVLRDAFHCHANGSLRSLVRNENHGFLLGIVSAVGVLDNGLKRDLALGHPPRDGSKHPGAVV